MVLSGFERKISEYLLPFLIEIKLNKTFYSIKNKYIKINLLPFI